MVSRTKKSVTMCLQVKSLEAEGMPSKQAEAVTTALTHVLNDTLENLAQSLVSKPELQKVMNFFFIC